MGVGDVTRWPAGVGCLEDMRRDGERAGTASARVGRQQEEEGGVRSRERQPDIALVWEDIGTDLTPIAPFQGMEIPPSQSTIITM